MLICSRNTYLKTKQAKNITKKIINTLYSNGKKKILDFTSFFIIPNDNDELNHSTKNKRRAMKQSILWLWYFHSTNNKTTITITTTINLNDNNNVINNVMKWKKIVSNLCVIFYIMIIIIIFIYNNKLNECCRFPCEILPP